MMRWRCCVSSQKRGDRLCCRRTPSPKLGLDRHCLLRLIARPECSDHRSWCQHFDSAGLRRRNGCFVTERRPQVETSLRIEPGLVIRPDKGSGGKCPDVFNVCEFDAAAVDPLFVKYLIDLPYRRSAGELIFGVGGDPCHFEPVECGTTAFRAGAVSRGKRGRLVKEEQFRITVGRHNLSVPVFEYQLTDQPCF